MIRLSRISSRLTFAILLTAVIPLIVTVVIARNLVRNVSAQLYNPRVGQELERSLGIYQELAKSLKKGMRYEAEAIAAREPLRAAAMLKHKPSVEAELGAVFPHYKNLVSLAVLSPDGDVIGEKKRERPVDPQRELTLQVHKPLSMSDDGPMLRAVFVTSKATFDQLKHASETVRLYRQIESALGEIGRGYLSAFIAVLVFTVLVGVIMGTLISKQVTDRLGELARAANKVGAGDLGVRVPERGTDELSSLSQAFNAMVGEVKQSRARIEFLQRMGIWQEMARRLAHEIKNPLTPIQLAVEELAARYDGDDPKFGGLLKTTTSIITEEVGTLRRLVTEFSSFARLPKAELVATDIASFMQQQRERIELLDDPGPGVDVSSLRVTWELPDKQLEAYIDQQMMHRVLANLLRNAAQAIRDEGNSDGQIAVTLQDTTDDWVEIAIEDNGPGIDEQLRETIFDPYVTTKEDGTGLGLSIVKKIIMDHGGSIEPQQSRWSGAKMLIRIPLATNPASVAVRQREQTAPTSARSWVLAKR